MFSNGPSSIVRVYRGKPYYWWKLERRGGSFLFSPGQWGGYSSNSSAKTIAGWWDHLGPEQKGIFLLSKVHNFLICAFLDSLNYVRPMEVPKRGVFPSKGQYMLLKNFHDIIIPTKVNLGRKGIHIDLFCDI